MSQAASCWSSVAASPVSLMSVLCRAALLPNWSVLGGRAAPTPVPAAVLPRGRVRSSQSCLRQTEVRALLPMGARLWRPPPLAQPPCHLLPPATGDRELRRRQCRPPPHLWGGPCRPSDDQRSSRCTTSSIRCI